MSNEYNILLIGSTNDQYHQLQKSVTHSNITIKKRDSISKNRMLLQDTVGEICNKSCDLLVYQISEETIEQDLCFIMTFLGCSIPLIVWAPRTVSVATVTAAQESFGVLISNNVKSLLRAIDGHYKASKYSNIEDLALDEDSLPKCHKDLQSSSKKILSLLRSHSDCSSDFEQKKERLKVTWIVGLLISQQVDSSIVRSCLESMLIPMEYLTKCVLHEQKGGNFSHIFEAQRSYVRDEILNKKLNKKPRKRQFDTSVEISNRNAAAHVFIQNRLDQIFLHPVFGIPIFFLAMLAMFLVSVNFGEVLQSVIENVMRFLLIDQAETILASIQAPTFVRTALLRGFGEGFIIVLSFVPMLFLFFSFMITLKDSGYLSRAAFLVDKFMRRIGVCGQALLPFIMGFGCNVPAILAAKDIKDSTSRISTIVMSPFMTCKARLAVFLLFCSTFFPSNKALIIFLLYLCGIFAAFFTSLVLKLFLDVKPEQHLILQLPPYVAPDTKRILFKAYNKTKHFVMDVGKMIIIFFFVIHCLNHITYPIGDAEGDARVGTQEQRVSVLQAIGKKVTPLLQPMGVKDDNWQASVTILMGAIGKELVISSTNALYDGEDLVQERDFSSGFHGSAAVLAYLIFILLYFPCISVFSTISKSLGFRWALFSAIWSTSLAYGCAVAFYQVSRIFM